MPVGFGSFGGKLRMLNEYEGSAIAESGVGIGVLAADNTAEQQNSVPEQMSSAQLLYSVVAHNVANPEKRITLSREQGKEIMKDFVDFVAGSSATPTTEDGRPKTFNDMDDNELLKCLSEFLGSGAVNTTINCGSIEAAQEAAELATMSDEELAELDNTSNPRVIAAKLRKAGIEAAQDAADREQERRMEERKELTAAEMKVLSGQTIRLGSTSATALEWRNSLDDILNNWDKSFDEMVSLGYAKPEEKDKKEKELLKLRKLIEDTKKTEQQKQQEIQEMLARGEISQTTIEYNEQKMQQERAARSAEATAQVVQRAASTETTISVEERKEDFSNLPANQQKSETVSLMAASNLISAPVKLTTVYNAESVGAEQQDKIIPIAPVLQKQAAATVEMNSAFG